MTAPNDLREAYTGQKRGPQAGLASCLSNSASKCLAADGDGLGMPEYNRDGIPPSTARRLVGQRDHLATAFGVSGTGPKSKKILFGIMSSGVNQPPVRKSLVCRNWPGFTG